MLLIQQTSFYPPSDHNAVGWGGTGTFAPLGTKPFIDHEGYGASLRVEWDLGNLILTSVTGYENFERDEYLDNDGTSLEIADQYFTSDLDGWSQEFRLSSNTDGALSWIVGANYAEDEIGAKNTF